jgi:tetratricopeptide (TPR) repeat protein
VVNGTLDRYAHGWIDARIQACKAALVTGEPQDVDRDPRVACLQDRLEELRAVVDEILKVSNDPQVAKAAVAADSIQSVTSCRHAVAYGARGPRTVEALARERGARTDLARAVALHYFGRDKQAAELADRAARSAEQDRNTLLLGIALQRATFSSFVNGYANPTEALKPEDLKARYYRSIELADENGDDATRVRAWAGLLAISDTDDPGLATVAMQQRAFDQGMSALYRLGGDDDLEGALHDAFAGALSSDGELDKAHAEEELALAAAERSGYTRLPGVILSNMAGISILRGDLDAAETELHRATQKLEQAYGAAHPIVLSTRRDEADVYLQRRDFVRARDLAGPLVDRYAEMHADSFGAAVAMDTLGGALLGLERFEEARAVLERALAIRAPPLARSATLVKLGQAYIGLHRPQAAIDALEQALSAYAGETVFRADACFALARVIAARDPKRARALAIEARDILDKVPRPTPLIDHLREQVRAWVTSLPAHP